MEEIVYPRYISNKPKGEEKFEGKSPERQASSIVMHITETDKEEILFLHGLLDLKENGAAISRR